MPAVASPFPQDWPNHRRCKGQEASIHLNGGIYGKKKRVKDSMIPKAEWNVIGEV